MLTNFRLNEAEKAAIVSDRGLMEDIVDILESGGEVFLYEDLDSFGREHDNDCREEDESYEEFGEFLCQNYKDNFNGNEVTVKLPSNRVLYVCKGAL